MELVCILGIALCGLVMQQVLSAFGKKELSLAVGIGCSVVLLGQIAPIFSELISKVQRMPAATGIDDPAVRIMFKVTGIALLTELGGQLCRDAGGGALAQKVELAGKGMILCAVVPLLSELSGAALRLLE